ncbi:hypothetical protein H8B02_36340 [Bradyrhizobium sp. Pear77]|uniref:hypothetical protein n=1 Tax=Bradyrhizobium altum TaxID=1571202 RepID=UPI001E4A7B6E|nr:hypothetical protein [Bradyrhizobium altum]MCC8958699.1 hypothetical protein [Bradyrhizobium altum]
MNATDDTDKTKAAKLARRYGRGKAKVANFLNTQVRRFLVDRHRPHLPDNKIGRDHLFVACHVAVNAGADEPKLRRRIKAMAPWLSEPETSVLIDKVYGKPLHYGPAGIGCALGVTDADRSRLSLWNIRPVDVTQEYLVKRRKAKKAAHKRDVRAENSSGRKAGRPAKDAPAWKVAGASSKATYYRNLKRAKTESPGETKTPSPAIFSCMYGDAIKVSPLSLTPWAALGMKRATYFRHKKAGTLPRQPVVQATAPTTLIGGINLRLSASPAFRSRLAATSSASGGKQHRARALA